MDIPRREGWRTDPLGRRCPLFQAANLERLRQLPGLVGMTRLAERLTGIMPVLLNVDFGTTRVVIDPLTDVVYTAPHGDPEVSGLVVTKNLVPVVLFQFAWIVVLGAGYAERTQFRS